MEHISVKDLTPLEFEMLEFNIKVVGYDESEEQFIYGNLFRDETGLVYYLVKGSNKKFAIHTH